MGHYICRGGIDTHRLTLLFITILLLQLFSFVIILPSIKNVGAVEIFGDGFESGDFSAWDSVVGSPSIVDIDSNCGLYAAEFDATQDYVYKTLDVGYSEIYYKLQFSTNYVPNINGKSISFMQFFAGSAGISNVDLVYIDALGGLVWRILYHDGSMIETLYADATVTVDTYYCIVFYTIIASNGAVRLYVDGENVVEQTDIDTDDYGNVDGLMAGTIYSNNDNCDVTLDCVVVADTYIDGTPVFITLDTNPAGLSVKMDVGSWFDAPHIFKITNGTTHSISCDGIESVGFGKRYVRESWNDTGANPHNISPSINTGYAATYKMQYFFDVNSVYDSPTGKGWYDNATETVHSNVTTPIGGYNTTGFTASGSLASGGTVNTNTTGFFTILNYTTCTWDWIIEKEGGGDPSTPDSYIPSDPEPEDVKPFIPTVFDVTDNAIAVGILVFLLLFSVVLRRQDYAVASNIVFVGFIFLAVNFAIVYLLVPMNLLPDSLSFIGEFSSLFKPPTLQLNTFSVNEQNVIQILFVVGGCLVALFSCVAFIMNEGDL